MQPVSRFGFAVFPFKNIDTDQRFQASRNGAMVITTEISRCPSAHRQSH